MRIKRYRCDKNIKSNLGKKHNLSNMIDKNIVPVYKLKDLSVVGFAW